MTELPRAPRYASLDFWRGLACLSIVLYHSVLIRQINHGSANSGVLEYVLSCLEGLWIGVPLFFVISGYCISAAADNSRLKRSGVADFFVRRIRRIYPPLWILIALSVGAFLVIDYGLIPGVLSDPPWPQRRPWWYSGWQWFGSLTLTETWRHYVIGSPRGIFPGHAWTLCYEEQFYALMGLLLFAPRWLFRGAAAITAFTLAMIVGSKMSGLPIEGFFFDGSWLMFAVGILVYYATNYGGTPARWVSSATFLVAAAAADAIPVPGTRAAFLFALAILWLRPFDRALSTATWARPIMYCGKICYSLYLTQQLPIKAVSTLLARSGMTSATETLLVTVPLCVAAAVIAGALFHRFVERYFLNAPRSSTRLANVPATGSQLSGAPHP